MNVDILKLLKRQNDTLVSELATGSKDPQRYLYEHCLIANKRRYLFELDNALGDNLQRYNSKNNRLSEYRTFSTKKYPFDLFETSITTATNTTTTEGMKPPPVPPQQLRSQFVNSPTSSNKMPPPLPKHEPQQFDQYNNRNEPSQRDVFAKPQMHKTGSYNSNSNSNVNTNIQQNLNSASYGNNGSQQTSQAASKFSSLKYEPRALRGYKRKNEDDEEQQSGGGGAGGKNNNYGGGEGESVYEKEYCGVPFKTAKEQLLIDNAKQNNSSGSNQSSSSSSYSNSLTKRPMTNNQAPPSTNNNNNPPAKRGIHSKFNLPIRNNEEEQQRHCGGGGSGNGNNASNNNNNNYNNIDMSKMKNIEPKLIEIITSEVMDRTPPITWNDIAGLEFVKHTIKEIVIWPMLRPGLRGPTKGLLLFGPPGTGKTLIAKCIANESKSTFFNISSSTLTSKWQGESEKLVKVLFEVARACQPAVIFLDEIDSLLSQRSDEDRESSRRLKTEFFVQMDGAGNDSSERILLIGATNRPQELDDAARRRFVKRLYIPLPDEHGRQQIVRNLLRKDRHDLTDEEIISLAELTDGYSGADMTNLCRESSLGPIRALTMNSFEEISISSISADQVRPINYQDFIDAMQQVRASVSTDDLDSYIKWNTTFGCAQVPKA